MGQDPFSDFQQSLEMYSRKRLHVALGISKCSKKREEKEYFVLGDGDAGFTTAFHSLTFGYFERRPLCLQSIISGLSLSQVLPFTIPFSLFPRSRLFPLTSVCLFAPTGDDQYRRERQRRACLQRSVNSVSAIDTVSRILFPASYGLLNLWYWYSYYDTELISNWSDPGFENSARQWSRVV